MAGGIVKKNKAKQEILAINTTMKNLATHMETLSKEVQAMMKGDADGPYWNGVKAKKFYDKAVKNYDNNAKDYDTARTNLQTIADRVDSACSSDK